MGIKIVLAFSNILFSKGIAMLLDGERDITVSRVLNPNEDFHAEQIAALESHIVLTDFTTLYNSFPGLETAEKRPGIILVDTQCGSENLVAAVLKKKINGVLLGQSDRDLLLKAVRAVSKGEIWLDNQTFKNILQGINALGVDKSSALSSREKEIVNLIGKGLRNKEIAHQLNISETTVKTHLNRIFHKLNLKARSELISYAIKNSEMGGNSATGTNQ